MPDMELSLASTASIKSLHTARFTISFQHVFLDQSIEKYLSIGGYFFFVVLFHHYCFECRHSLLGSLLRKESNPE
jgi:hypothetical protein